MTSTPSYQHILVATDFSSAAEAALMQAVWVARASGGKITLVHVLPEIRRAMHFASLDAKLDLLYGEGSQFDRELRGDCNQRLEKLVAAVSEPDLEIRSKLLIGEPYVEICRAVKQGSYDLVITGTHSSNAWNAFFVGSTARRLIRKCPAPVWIAKPEHNSVPKVVLAATDFSTISQRAAEAGLALAQAASADFHLLHVVDSSDVLENAIATVPHSSSLRKEINDVAKQRFDEFISSLSTARQIRPHLSWGTPWQEVVRLVREHKVDLLSMGTVGRCGISGLLMGNTAEKVLGSCDCNVLTVKSEEFNCPIPLTE